MEGPKTPSGRDPEAPTEAPDSAVTEPASPPLHSVSVSIGTGRTIQSGGRGGAFKPNVTSFWIPAARDADATIKTIADAGARPANQPSEPGDALQPGGTSGAGAAPSLARDSAGSPATPATGRIPFRVGSYEVATRIAQGGMGSIYVCRKADSPDAHRLFVLKVVRQHASREDTAAESFRQEARVGALFRHPNAQTVVDRGMYENQPFLILDYTEGMCLADLQTSESKPPPGIVVSILLDVLSALEAAHRVVDRSGKLLGLVHGDVSAENILVGIDGVARLTDFGSSRFTAVGEAGARGPFALAKPASMSPEQFRGDALDARSDIFSVGVVLWTALAGENLFAAATYDQTLMNVMRKKVVPPSHFGAPEGLDDVCLQALSRWPEGRFTTAAEMAQALRRVAAPANLIESRDGVGRWVRRGMGDALAEQRRRIEYMFGSGDGTPLPTSIPRSVPPAGEGPPPGADGAASKKQKWARTQVISRKDVNLALASVNPALASARGDPAATEDRELDGDAAREEDDQGDDASDSTLVLGRLTSRQRGVVIGMSVAVFLGTVVIGLLLTQKPATPVSHPAAHDSTAQRRP